jgi:NADPH:quinone reductase-like Zn-dependent oxidoreductase
MQAYEVQDAFGLDNLKKAERPDPKPGPKQILVRVKAVSINYRDLLLVQGLYNPRQPLPIVPFSDGAGEVVAVGEGVTRFKPGDRVANCFFQGWDGGKPSPEKVATTAMGSPLDGMLRELAVLEEGGAVHLPGHLSYEEGATLPCAGLTAWSCLFRHGNVGPGDTVLTLGTGGVSNFALQLARMAGADVIVTSSHDEKLERAKKLGATHGINYKTHEQWSKEVKKATGGAGVDHVIEVGGVGTLEQSIRSCKMGGHISLVGVLAGPQAPLNLTLVLMQDIRIQGVFVGPRESFEDMNRAIVQHKLKPVIDKTFPFKDVRAALDYTLAGKHFGKVCVTVGD